MRVRSILFLATTLSAALCGCSSSSSSPGPASDAAPDTAVGDGSSDGHAPGDGSADTGVADGGQGDATTDSGTDSGTDATIDAGDATAEAGPTEGGPLSDAGDTGAPADAGDGAPSDAGPLASTQRVLLISVDGLHQVDLQKYIAAKPTSALAKLAATGVQYTAAHTTTPSDSFPGLLSFVTGGTPKTHGVYYDDSYDRTLYPPPAKMADGGADTCAGSPGTEVLYDESVEYDDSRVFSGGINPANLPHKKDVNGNCVPVYPHEFLKTNTIFEVIKAAGHYTAWSDKHPAYDLVNGPSGTGVDDLFTPEVNSLIVNGGTVNGVDLTGSQALCNAANAMPSVTDFTTCEPAIIAYDQTKVKAILNEIDGKSSDGTLTKSVPTIFGMNFQSVSVGQKLTVGGYTDAAGTPSVVLQSALDFVDTSLAAMVAELTTKGLLDTTLIIVSAKHGQSPIDKSKLAMERGDAAVTDPLGDINTIDSTVDSVVSTFQNPNSGNNYARHGHFQTDDVGLLWLQDQSKTAAVVTALNADKANIHADTLPPGTIFTTSIVSGAALNAIYGDPATSAVAAARAPDLIIQPNWGVIYSGSSKKIAEHGGGTVDDTNVALLVSIPSIGAGSSVATPVTTTQVAPTILKSLRIDPGLLHAVVAENTAALPGL